MSSPLEDFKGTLPYAAEMFGVYQPLLGWKSRSSSVRLTKERRRWAEALVRAMVQDSRFRHDIGQTFKPIGPDASVLPRLAPGLQTPHAAAAAAAVQDFLSAHGRLPTGTEWVALVNKAITTAPAGSPGLAVGPGGASQPPAGTAPRASTAAVTATPNVVHESIVAGTLRYLSNHAPQVLESLLITQLRNWDLLSRFVDPLASFDPQTQQVVLSPIGIVELFREYFYEFRTFLGPPVGHVWVSPGASVELFEIHTRRTREEHEITTATETLSRTDSSIVETDELATAVGQQNATNLNFGASVSGSVNFGVVQVGAQASLGYSSAHTTAETEAHKHSRQQSTKLSTEIRRNFKTVFRTSVEQTDTSSKRYVLANTTDKLLNYELRRKMRQVGVQVQHIGTQLCWQIHIDEPGFTLGIGELVHLAKATDLDEAGVRAPDAPVYPEAKETEVTVAYAFETRHLIPYDESEADSDETYTDGQHDSDLIIASRDYLATPPAVGYVLAPNGVNEVAVKGTDPSKDPPDPVAAGYMVTGPSQFTITLHQVNFNDQPELLFDVKLIWVPDSKTKKLIDDAYQQKVAEYTEKKRQVEHADFVNAVKQRVDLASQIKPRDGNDLREEERTVIFRRLIAQLTQLKISQPPHLTAELIRAIFDVESMLYFVAPEWWLPRMHYKQRVSPPPGAQPPEVLTENDSVSWGGAASLFRDNYLISENSAPAPLGASLGWLLQLDGDAHRNAFLNSPWVKAIVPIRRGRERAALNWLKLAHVEGTDGLADTYGGPEPALHGKTIEQVIMALADQISDQSDPKNVLATETVFEHGFDPLEGGFRATGEPFAVFDQWVEVLPTEQVVAVEVKYDPKTGKEL
jgi:hypothetical protein